MYSTHKIQLLKVDRPTFAIRLSIALGHEVIYDCLNFEQPNKKKLSYSPYQKNNWHYDYVSCSSRSAFV